MPRLRLPRIVFFGRTAEEYARIWKLSLADLAGLRILDCPCGPASFIGACHDAGIDAIGVDPMMAFTVEEMRRTGLKDIEDTMAAIESSDAGLASSDPETWTAEKHQALEHFLVDFRRHGPGGDADDGRYVAASLPNLPFADQSFDMAFSAHLLFSYASVENGGLVESSKALDLAFHLDAVTELARVTRQELRLFPAVIMASDEGGPHPWVDPIRDRLQSLGFEVRMESSDYDEGLTTSNALLIASRGAVED
ncbi:MAG: hypothetical protein O3A19_01525 [Planctomycetota bacterium]|nr:hypothetical protein [Planctomycetota bacterium]